MSTRGHRSSRRSKAPALTAYQQKEIDEAFIKFDSDKSGTIDRHELRVALRAMGFEITKSETQKLMDEYDPEGTGLKKEGFVLICAQKMAQRNPDEEIKKSFTLFDVNQDRHIDESDLAAVIREVGLNFDKATIKAMISEFDPDGKGYISLNDFNEIINPTTSY